MKTGIKGIRRVSAVAITAGAVLTAGAFAAPAQAATLPTPTITAKGGFVMNNGTGKSLFTKAADTRRSTGSTTKIMTARVVLGQSNLNLDSKVTVQKAYSDYIVNNNWASSARLIVGDKVSVRQLLYGLMLPSGCDAAYALADKFGSGSTRGARVKSFIGKMNATAKSLGLTNTHFDSFDGIGHGSNYSTPRDLTKLASNAMKYSTFRTVVGTKSTKQKVTTKSGGYRYMTWDNTNTLLGSYAGTIGVKTGSGPEAKYCLVFAATRNGKTVIGAVLAAPSVADRTADAKKLLDYGFKK
ncbi:D-alanyl-D-alanine carboxypeptidase family protein [Streptomyces lydicus]|uniref:D-alanyl-D-alanine carboxypeptidase n=1 Tax=Streptomyces lydicus TaxID=47763 RepID=A0A1D7VGS9_9ACTN|nr:serine hydrolase [Streptomyces lydicus]AOP45940.1 D-alanyl-D-alanine carboxypeptidase [Streptomyces lydicus]